MNELTRSIEELMVLYQLEPETKDIFVEGITDKLVIERFADKNDFLNTRVIEVHEIDFSSLYEDFPIIRSNNKAKLLALNSRLEDDFGDSLKGICIVIDRDYDEIRDVLKEGNYLFYTDYHSMELYLYNSHTIDIFFRHYLHSFPLNGLETIQVLEPVLIKKSLVRLVCDLNGPIPTSKFTKFENTISINKKTYVITFDHHHHIQKILNNVGRMKEYDRFITCWEDVVLTLDTENKKNIKGHDFINLFFQFVDKIKNHIGFTIDTFVRALYHCLDFSRLQVEPLFRNLLLKYQ